METHFAGNVGQNPVAIRQLDPKHGIRKQLDDSAFYFNCVFPRHVRISGPSFVIKTVCSKWAERVPSAVRTVHPTASNRSSELPTLTIRSIASGMRTLSFAAITPRLQFGSCFAASKLL